MFRRRSFSVFLLGVVLGCAGCTTPAPHAVPPVTAPARLAVTNLSGYAWSLVVRAPDEREINALRVAPRGEAEVQLAPGDYVIAQTLLDAGVATEPTRRVAFHAEAGQRYTWSLSTLLSSTAATEVSVRE